MKIIGITGGIGSGKSEVLNYLEREFSVCICQADEVARNLQKKGEPCYREIVRVFGADILDSEEELNRARLAEIVFSDENKLHMLNQIVHPIVKKTIFSMIDEAKANNQKLFVLETALLLEEHYDDICDEVWYIHADEYTRRKRLKISRGYTDEKITSIFEAQLSRDEYLNKCDRAIDNSRSFEETCVQLTKLVSDILKK